MTLRSSLGRLKERLFYPYAVRAGFEDVYRRIEFMERRLERIQQALGRIEGRQVDGLDDRSLLASEFQVFSQWGEDGIVRELVRRVECPRPVFVEFGVEAYHESNTRFLLKDRNWTGLVMDGDPHAVQRIRNSRVHWLHDLTAAHAWITRDNINALLEEHGVTGPIGLLSIDVDGMDYWIWEAIEVIDPTIVIVEYNFRFGSQDTVTVPYDEAFDRRTAHPSLLSYGASLAALNHLGRRKGYDLVACGSAGLNAFFVKRNARPDSIPVRSVEEAYREGRFHETHEEGVRVKRSLDDQATLARALPLVDVTRLV